MSYLNDYVLEWAHFCQTPPPSTSCTNHSLTDWCDASPAGGCYISVWHWINLQYILSLAVLQKTFTDGASLEYLQSQALCCGWDFPFSWCYEHLSKYYVVLLLLYSNMKTECSISKTFYMLFTHKMHHVQNILEIHNIYRLKNIYINQFDCIPSCTKNALKLYLLKQHDSIKKYIFKNCICR